MGHPRVYTYDPARVTVAVGPILIESGFVGNVFCRAKASKPRWKKIVGCDGEVIRVRQLDSSGTVEIVLEPYSGYNAALQALQTLDEFTSSGVLPVFIRDRNGFDLVVGVSSWISEVPDQEKGEEPQDAIRWALDVDQLHITHLGMPPTEAGADKVLNPLQTLLGLGA